MKTVFVVATTVVVTTFVVKSVLGIFKRRAAAANASPTAAPVVVSNAEVEHSVDPLPSKDVIIEPVIDNETEDNLSNNQVEASDSISTPLEVDDTIDGDANTGAEQVAAEGPEAVLANLTNDNQLSCELTNVPNAADTPAAAAVARLQAPAASVAAECHGKADVPRRRRRFSKAKRKPKSAPPAAKHPTAAEGQPPRSFLKAKRPTFAAGADTAVEDKPTAFEKPTLPTEEHPTAAEEHHPCLIVEFTDSDSDSEEEQTPAMEGPQTAEEQTPTDEDKPTAAEEKPFSLIVEFSDTESKVEEKRLGAAEKLKDAAESTAWDEVSWHDVSIMLLTSVTSCRREVEDVRNLVAHGSVPLTDEIINSAWDVVDFALEFERNHEELCVKGTFTEKSVRALEKVLEETVKAICRLEVELFAEFCLFPVYGEDTKFFKKACQRYGKLETVDLDAYAAAYAAQQQQQQQQYEPQDYEAHYYGHEFWGPPIITRTQSAPAAAPAHSAGLTSTLRPSAPCFVSRHSSGVSSGQAGPAFQQQQQQRQGNTSSSSSSSRYAFANSSEEFGCAYLYSSGGESGYSSGVTSGASTPRSVDASVLQHGAEVGKRGQTANIASRFRQR